VEGFEGDWQEPLYGFEQDGSEPESSVEGEKDGGLARLGWCLELLPSRWGGLETGNCGLVNDSTDTVRWMHCRTEGRGI